MAKEYIPYDGPIVTREDAETSGGSYYFTGVPCKNGHLSQRRVIGKKCRTCCNVGALRAYFRNRDERIQYMKSYGKSETNKARKKKYRDSHREQLSASKKAWYTNNKDRAKEYQQNRKEDYAVHARVRRTRITKAGGTHTQEDIADLLNKQKSRCANCLCKLKKYHVDHVMPVALGGGSNKVNLQVLCPTCNHKKNRKHPDKWAREHGRLV